LNFEGFFFFLPVIKGIRVGVVLIIKP
jgi:hypothetical protein